MTCFEIKITKSDFKSENGHNFVGNKNYDDLKQRSQELMIKVEDLKVFEFEAGGEYDCVIARNEEEAKNYYATIIDNREEYEM